MLPFCLLPKQQQARTKVFHPRFSSATFSSAGLVFGEIASSHKRQASSKKTAIQHYCATTMKTPPKPAFSGILDQRLIPAPALPAR